MSAQSDDGAQATTQTQGSSAVLAEAMVGGDIAEQRALSDVKKRLFGKALEPVRIGRYALLEKLGSGGLGVVYLARDPELDRRVAIKLMRSTSTQSTRHLARFAREARAMAQVSHPNVVEVFDVGDYDLPPDWPLAREAPPSGVFIAMAYVDGGSLRDWLVERTRTWRKALELLVAAGHGLAAAHAAGLCHRDFKPANVLIGSDGRPRVVDFGLARLLEPGSEGDASDGGVERPIDPSITATGSVVGTPAYMAPEQHRGEEVGPAADQFAFCVTAFEALYGQRPFPQKNLSALAVAKQEGEVATVRSTGVPAAVQRVLLRGLLHEPSDRHTSMDHLLAALDRAARGRLPRWTVATIPVIGLAVVAGLVAIQPQRASQCDTAEARWSAAWGAEQAARVESAFEATRVPFATTSFARVSAELDGYAQAWIVAHEAACASATSDDVTFDRGLSCLARRLKQVETLVGAFVEADAHLVERSAVLVGSLPAPAECLSEAANAALPRPDSPELLVGIFAAREQLDVASTLRRAGRFADARKKASAVLVDAAAIGFEPLEAEALVELGSCEGELGDFDASERLISEAYYLAERTGYDRLSADAATLLVGVLAESPKRFDEAQRWAEHARAALERGGNEPSMRARLLSVTAGMNYRAGRMDDAIADGRAAKEIYEQVDPDGDSLATSLANFGGFLAVAGLADEAEPHLRRSLELREKLLGPQHPSVAQSVNALAQVYSKRADYAESSKFQQRALAIWEASLGPEHPLVAMGLSNVATGLSRLGDLEGAEAHARRALALREKQFAEDHVDVGFSRIVLAEILLHCGKLDEAYELGQRGLPVLTAALGNEHQYVAFANIVLAQVADQRGQLELAREHWERTVALLNATPNDPLFAQAHAGLGGVLLRLGDAAAAVPELELAVDALEHDPSALPRAQDQLARALWHEPTQHDRARELARVALNAYGADVLPDADERRADLRQWLEQRPVTGDR